MSEWQQLLERLFADPLPAMIQGTRPGRGVEIRAFNTVAIVAMLEERGWL